MQQFIEECLKPIYKLNWLQTIPIDDHLYQNLTLFVAYSDKRLF